jgi:hypothetical protein
MTESEWLVCADPAPMLDFLQAKASVRTQRLFVVACCRRIWKLMDSPIKQVVEVAERYVDGNATEPELASSRAVASAVPSAIVANRVAKAAWLSTVMGSGATWRMIGRVASAAAWEASGEREDRPQADLLRCIFGNPFRPSPPLASAVLAWNDGTVRRIAEGVYEERKMPEGTLDTARLAILADALLDAGCDNEELIAHLRGEGPHVRGCWALDLILGKE